jgi:hypothetical protein
MDSKIYQAANRRYNLEDRKRQMSDFEQKLDRALFENNEPKKRESKAAGGKLQRVGDPGLEGGGRQGRILQKKAGRQGERHEILKSYGKKSEEDED